MSTISVFKDKMKGLELPEEEVRQIYMGVLVERIHDLKVSMARTILEAKGADMMSVEGGYAKGMTHVDKLRAQLDYFQREMKELVEKDTQMIPALSMNGREADSSEPEG